MSNNKESTFGTISKWVARTLGSAVAIVGIIWVGLQHGNKQYDLGYSQGHGDTQVLRQLIEHKDDEINNLNNQIKVISESLDSLSYENIKLKDLLKSNVVVSDTIIYEQDAIALFGGKVTIQCDAVDTISRLRSAGISGTIYEGREPKFFGLDGMVGVQTSFEFAGNKYLLVVLGCRGYEKGPGVKIAVYKQ